MRPLTVSEPVLRERACGEEGSPRVILKGAAGAGAVQMISISSIWCKPSSDGRVEVRFTISRDSCARRECGTSADAEAGRDQRGLEHCAESHDVRMSCNGCFYPSDHGVVVAVHGQIPSSVERYSGMARVVVPNPKIVLSLED